MKKIKFLSLTEDAVARDAMTPYERAVHKQIYNLLCNDGHGHYHAIYAKIFNAYPITIVPLGKSPETAAISPEERIIYINKGFLTNPATFYQLGVIIRHELMHSLLQHQIRMMQKLSSKIPEMNLRFSGTLHEVCNTLEDFEISRKYSEDDKVIIHETWLNGRIISGLVVEDHRLAWRNYTVEQMWDAFIKEMAKTNFDGQTNWKNEFRINPKKFNSRTGKYGVIEPAISSNLEAGAQQLVAYKHTPEEAAEYNSPQELYDRIMASSKKANPNAKMPEAWQNIFDGLAKIEKAPEDFSTADLNKMIKYITDTSPIEHADILNPMTGEVLCTAYTPEEKTIAIYILQVYAGKTPAVDDYNRWYAEIMRVAKTMQLTDDEIADLLSALK